MFVADDLLCLSCYTLQRRNNGHYDQNHDSLLLRHVGHFPSRLMRNVFQTFQDCMNSQDMSNESQLLSDNDYPGVENLLLSISKILYLENSIRIKLFSHIVLWFAPNTLMESVCCVICTQKSVSLIYTDEKSDATPMCSIFLQHLCHRISDMFNLENFKEPGIEIQPVLLPLFLSSNSRKSSFLKQLACLTSFVDFLFAHNVGCETFASNRLQDLIKSWIREANGSNVSPLVASESTIDDKGCQNLIDIICKSIGDKQWLQYLLFSNSWYFQAPFSIGKILVTSPHQLHLRRNVDRLLSSIIALLSKTKSSRTPMFVLSLEALMQYVQTTIENNAWSISCVLMADAHVSPTYQNNSYLGLLSTLQHQLVYDLHIAVFVNRVIIPACSSKAFFVTTSTDSKNIALISSKILNPEVSTFFSIVHSNDHYLTVIVRRHCKSSAANDFTYAVEVVDSLFSNEFFESLENKRYSRAAKKGEALLKPSSTSYGISISEFLHDFLAIEMEEVPVSYCRWQGQNDVFQCGVFASFTCLIIALVPEMRFKRLTQCNSSSNKVSDNLQWILRWSFFLLANGLGELLSTNVLPFENMQAGENAKVCIEAFKERNCIDLAQNILSWTDAVATSAIFFPADSSEESEHKWNSCSVIFSNIAIMRRQLLSNVSFETQEVDVCDQDLFFDQSQLALTSSFLHIPGSETNSIDSQLTKAPLQKEDYNLVPASMKTNLHTDEFRTESRPDFQQKDHQCDMKNGAILFSQQISEAVTKLVSAKEDRALYSRSHDEKEHGAFSNSDNTDYRSLPMPEYLSIKDACTWICLQEKKQGYKMKIKQRSDLRALLFCDKKILSGFKSNELVQGCSYTISISKSSTKSQDAIVSQCARPCKFIFRSSSDKTMSEKGCSHNHKGDEKIMSQTLCWISCPMLSLAQLSMLRQWVSLKRFSTEEFEQIIIYTYMSMNNEGIWNFDQKDCEHYKVGPDLFLFLQQYKESDAEMLTESDLTVTQTQHKTRRFEITKGNDAQASASPFRMQKIETGKQEKSQTICNEDLARAQLAANAQNIERMQPVLDEKVFKTCRDDFVKRFGEDKLNGIDLRTIGEIFWNQFAIREIHETNAPAVSEASNLNFTETSSPQLSATSSHVIKPFTKENILLHHYSHQMSRAQGSRIPGSSRKGSKKEATSRSTMQRRHSISTYDSKSITTYLDQQQRVTGNSKKSNGLKTIQELPNESEESRTSSSAGQYLSSTEDVSLRKKPNNKEE